jgi:UDP-glucose:(heptosyl)LPS alpha-1,3-glucosyltransferase
MRIALIIQHADPARGGAERYTMDLSRALAHRGHDVSLVASSFAEEPWEVRKVHLATPAPTRVLKYAQFLKYVDDHVYTTPYDIVHAMLPIRRCNVYHPHAGVEAQMQQTAHLKHEGALRQKAARMGGAFNLRRKKAVAVEGELLTSTLPPLVLCLSNYVKQAVLQHYSIDSRWLATLHNGIDLRRFDPQAQRNGEIRRQLGIGENKVVALFVAQDFQRKGLREAIAAVGRIRDSRLVLMVVGRDNPAPYRSLVRDAKANDRVFFAGPVRDTSACYREADFFLLPTRHDPCSLVVLEALAMGLPVISTTSNGSTELMTHEKHGYVLRDPKDIAALTEAMQKMLDDAQRTAMSKQCLKLRPRLSHDHHVEELLRIYQTRVDTRRLTTA